MNYDALEKLLLSRKGAARDYPFGPEAAIFKVAGKMLKPLYRSFSKLRIAGIH